MDSSLSPETVLNLNVGILGHVDSGKTSLAKSLSVVAGTAAFDKNPQSQERGITIDLGFSAIVVDVPTKMCSETSKTKLQFTFVDCPGHASLIRTVIGGSQIIHMMLLVVDVTKGMQTQTAECLVIGEIMCQNMLVVLNKIDLLPAQKRSSLIEKMKKKMSLTLANTVFKNAPIVAVSALPTEVENSSEECGTGLDRLLQSIKDMAFLPMKELDKPFVFAVDHCFNIRGRGTIMTGTVIQGKVSLKDEVQVPSIGFSGKVKSMQMFHRPVETAEEGDRLGMCVPQLDSKQLERGLVCRPDYISFMWAAILKVHRIKYFQSNVKSNNKFHISIGYETVMANITIFAACGKDDAFHYEADYELQEELSEGDKYFALLEFERPVLAIPNSLAIGSRLEMDVNGSACRLAFWGRIVQQITDKAYEKTYLPQMKIFKMLEKKGTVERVVKNDAIIAKNLIKKESNAQAFVGLSVVLSSGECGVIDSAFGKSGKLNIHIPDGLKEETILKYKKQGTKKGEESDQPTDVILRFKRYIFDHKKKMVQV